MCHDEPDLRGDDRRETQVDWFFEDRSWRTGGKGRRHGRRGEGGTMGSDGRSGTMGDGDTVRSAKERVIDESNVGTVVRREVDRVNHNLIRLRDGLELFVSSMRKLLLDTGSLSAPLRTLENSHRLVKLPSSAANFLLSLQLSVQLMFSLCPSPYPSTSSTYYSCCCYLRDHRS